MIGLDTNVLVRYLTQDDPRQAALANELMEKRLGPENPGFVSVVVLVELAWVLEVGYRQDRTAIALVLERLLRAKPLVIETAEVAWQAVRLFAAGSADFADCIIERIGKEHDCEYTLTFDRQAARDAGMRLLGR